MEGFFGNDPFKKISPSLWKIKNESFFKRLIEASKEPEIHEEVFKKKYLTNMTIDQLDLIKTLYKSARGFDIINDEFQLAYFLKTFCTELSQQNYEADNEKRLKILERMYDYAASRNFSKKLSYVLLEEMLMLTVKIDKLDEKLFKEYLDLVNSQVDKKDYKFNQKKSSFLSNNNNEI